MGISQPEDFLKQDQATLNLAAEKRRNKLGYHRTSVACGHCRRRKIRCIPTPNSPPARCNNCVRLKKECSFFPVDQQPSSDTRKNPISKSLTMPPPSMKPSGGDLPSPGPKLSERHSFDFGHGGISNWKPILDASPQASKPSENGVSWQSNPQESCITPAFSPYTSQASPTSATWATQSESSGYESEDFGWSYPPPPMRSMSFSSDTLSNHRSRYQQQAYLSRSQVVNGRQQRSSNGNEGHTAFSPFERKPSAALIATTMSDLYNASNTIPGFDSTPETSPDQQESLMAGAASVTAFASLQQPYSYGKSASEAYVGWSEQNVAPASEVHGDYGVVYTV